MFCNLLSDWVTGNKITNKPKNQLQLSKMIGTNVYNRYESDNIESRSMEGIEVVDSMADRKILILESSSFLLTCFLCRCTCFFQTSAQRL